MIRVPSLIQRTGRAIAQEARAGIQAQPATGGRARAVSAECGPGNGSRRLLDCRPEAPREGRNALPVAVLGAVAGAAAAASAPATPGDRHLMLIQPA